MEGERGREGDRTEIGEDTTEGRQGEGDTTRVLREEVESEERTLDNTEGRGE